MARNQVNPQHTSVFCTYRVQPKRKAEFLVLLENHWPTLSRLGLVTPEPSLIFEADDENQQPCFHELFTWRNAEAPNRAHELPEVMAIWEPMGKLTEARGSRPPMEFPHMRSLRMRFSKG